MLLMPTPDADGIAKTKQIVFNRTGQFPTDEEAAQLLGGVMRYLYLLRRLDQQLRDNWQGPLPEPQLEPQPKPRLQREGAKGGQGAKEGEGANTESATQSALPSGHPQKGAALAAPPRP